MAQLVQRICHMAGGGSSTKAGALKKAGWHRPGTAPQTYLLQVAHCRVKALLFWTLTQQWRNASVSLL